MQVTTHSQNQKSPNLIQTQLKLEKLITNSEEISNSEEEIKTRDISHIQCISWPDYGIPDKEERVLIEELINLIEEHRERMGENLSKIVVHCR